MTAAKKTQEPADADEARGAHDDEITIARRVKLPPDAYDSSLHPTTRMTRVDTRLLAIARGEMEPEEQDPFGGLIPIYDNDEAEALEVEDGWLVMDSDGDAAEGEGLFGRTVPSLRMLPHLLLALPIDEAASFFLSQIDGKRSVEELIDVCGLDDLGGLEIVDELLRLGAIELR